MTKEEDRLQLESVACNLCGSTRAAHCFNKPGSLTGINFNIVRCEKCGMRYVNPRLSAAAIERLYSEDYFRGDGFDSSVNYTEELQSDSPPEEAVRALRRIRSMYPDAARILEVGPGMGSFMRMASEAGYEISGLELSAFAVQELTALGLDVMQGGFPEPRIADASMDVVVAIEVIEHVPDPMRFLCEVRRILKPGGLFYYETGNAECEQAMRLGAAWDYIMPEGHLYYFSPRHMTGYMEKTGFDAAYPNWSRPDRTVSRLLRTAGLRDEGEILPQGLRGRLCKWILSSWDRVTSDNDNFPMAIAR